MKFLKETENIPRYLYHATYKPFLKSIREKGLGNTNKKMYSDSKGRENVYLAKDPEVAYSYAENSEWVEERDNPDYYYDNIITLKIDTNKINKNNLFDDENVRDNNDDSTVEYHGIIPFSAIVDIIEEKY